MSIINTFPTTIANGQVEDATVVMSLFAWIQSQTNGNACPATTGSAVLKGNGAGGTLAATPGTDYSGGTQALATGIVKSTTGTGALTIAAPGTDYAAATSGSAILKGNGAGGFSSAVAGTDYQAALGFTPVQQGTGTNQGTNAVKIGWGSGPYASKVALQIDATDMGFLWPIDTAGNASSATKLSTASGSAPSYGARAWCAFNNTGALLAAGNVSSVTRTGVGQFTVNFTTPMPDTNYAVQITGQRVSGNSGAQFMESEITARTTSSFSILCDNQAGVFVDPLITSVTVFR